MQINILMGEAGTKVDLPVAAFPVPADSRVKHGYNFKTTHREQMIPDETLKTTLTNA